MQFNYVDTRSKGHPLASDIPGLSRTASLTAHLAAAKIAITMVQQNYVALPITVTVDHGL